MGYQDLTEVERARVREQFYNPETTREKRIELLTMMQNSADEVKMGRQCPRCKHFPFYAPHDEALIEGHVYSEEGMAEIGITGYCEFCFDLVTKEPDEGEWDPKFEEPVTGNAYADPDRAADDLAPPL